MPKLYACQLDCVWHEPDANHDAARDAISHVSVAPGSMIVLPEMFDVGFSMDARVACAASDHTRAFISNLARSTRSTVVAGHAIRDADANAVNQASIIGPDGKSIAHYTKCQSFTPAGEHHAYTPGGGPVVFDWAGLKASPSICYDLRFPELFRSAAKLGAELFVVIANWPVARVEHWVTLAKARAIENQAYVVAVNRCGDDPKWAYPGRSLVIDPKGEIIAEAGDGVEVITVDIDPELVRGWRRDFPALRDARFL